MWGYEDEQMPDIEATIEHVKRSRPDIFFTTVAYPIKGTPYYEQTKDRLVQLEAWSTSSDREIKIRGRHSRRFYDYADRVLRDEVKRSLLAGHDGPGAGGRSGEPNSRRPPRHDGQLCGGGGMSGCTSARTNPAGVAFDSIAEQYDDIFTRSLIGRRSATQVGCVAGNISCGAAGAGTELRHR